MFRERTVIVIGAAASRDFKFPLGKDLKSEIAALLRWGRNDRGRIQLSRDQEHIYRHVTSGDDPQLAAGRIISEGISFASSVDNFLEMRKNEQMVLEIGKRAISHIILQRERRCSTLRWSETTENNYTTALDKTWHQIFSEICFERCAKGDLPAALSRFQVISFNYDRCFEQFVRLAISRLYSISFSESCQIADESLKVWHPYGSLGKLCPEGYSKDGLAFGFAEPISADQLSNKIKTFTEQEAISEGELDAVRNCLSEADTVVFLGWGFHTQNIQILSPKRPTDRKARRVIATSLGLSEAAKHHTRERLVNSLLPPDPYRQLIDKSENIVLSSVNCRELLDAHRLDLIE